MRFFTAFLLLFSLSAAPLQAAVLIDQDYLLSTDVANGLAVPVGNIPYYDVPSSFSLIQTFTAGTTGTLSLLQFQGGKAYDTLGQLTMSLIDGDYDAGARTIVTTSTLDFNQLALITPGAPPLIDFALGSAEYQVAPGQRYSVVFDAASPDQFGFLAMYIGAGTPQDDGTTLFTGSGYNGGVSLAAVNGILTFPTYDYDVGFRSYVDAASTAAVPEPASWAMLIAGFGMIGLMIRRKPTAFTAKATITNS